MTKLKSWRIVLFSLLTAFILSMIVLFSYAFLHFYRQTQESFQTENQQTVDLWNSQVETRLSAVGYQLHQLMIEIYNDMQTAPGRLPMTYEHQKDYLDIMDDALLANQDGTCFYIKDTESDLFLFAAGNNLSGSEVLSLKDYVKGDTIKTTNLTNPRWFLVTIGKKLYFTRNIPLGRYIIGTMSVASKYDASSLMGAYDRDYSLLFVTEETIYPISGENWSGQLRITEGKITLSSELFTMNTKDLSIAEGTTVLLTEQLQFRDLLSESSVMLVIFSLLVIALLILTLHLLNKMIYQPTGVMMKALEEFGEEGNPDYSIQDDPGSEEFAALFHAFNNMTSQIHTLKIEAYDRQIEEQKQELTRLRQQLVPHFYLNAITTVSNMTYQNDGETIRKYLSTLASYMRYMMNLKDRQVPLDMELTHIRNYLELQQARFPDSVYAYIGCPDRLKDVEIPYLLVFTLVENTIKHAMNLYSTLQVLIQCEEIKTESFTGLRVTVEDDGPGFDPETLEKYTNRLEELPRAKEHIGLTNVIRTMQLTYHRTDLVRFSNAPGHGAHVELYIPYPTAIEEEPHENIDL